LKYAIAFFLTFASHLAYCEQPDEKYNALVDEALELTGGLAVAGQISDLFIGEFIKALKRGKEKVPEEVVAVVQEEVRNIIGESIASGEFQALLYPIYAEHISRKDLKAMIRFYKSKAGKRIVATLPVVAQESMAAGQAWGKALGPEVSKRIREKLDDIGYTTTQPTN